MNGSWSLNPVVELRTLFEGLPTVVRRPIELVVFGGDLPRADVSGMRWMAGELRSKAAAMNRHAEDAEKILAQEDSLGALGDRVREILHLHREGAARLREEALALADQAHAAANDAEKTLCVMFAFGVELAWRIIATLSAAAAAGPAAEVAAAPVVESMLIEGRGKVALMRAGLEQAYKVGAAKTAARLSALGPHQFAFAVGKAAALPAGVDGGVQLMQVGSGDRIPTVKGPNGENPRGIDLKSIEAAAVSGAGGAMGGIAAGTIAPRVFPRLETSRSALGLVQGVAGAVSGLGAAALITGWPEHFEDVLASLLSGGFAGVVDVHGGAHSNLGSPLAKVIDGSGAYVPPDPATVNLSKDAVMRLAGAPQSTKSLTPAAPAPVDSNVETTPRPVNSALPGQAMGAGASLPGENLVSSGLPGATGDGQHELDEPGELAGRLADSGSGDPAPAPDGHANGQTGADGQPADPNSAARQGDRSSADGAGDGAPGVDLPADGDEPAGGAAQNGGNAQGGSGAAQTSEPAHGGGAQASGPGNAQTEDGGQAGSGGGAQAHNAQTGGGIPAAGAGNGQAGGGVPGAGGGGNGQAGGVPGAGGGAQAGSGVASGAVLSGAGGNSGSEPQRSVDHGEDDAQAVGGSRSARAPVGDGVAAHEPAVARPPGSAKVDPPAEVRDASGRHGASGEGPARVTAPTHADAPPAHEPSVVRSEDAAPADARPSVQDGPDRQAEQLAQQLVALPSADPATKQDLTAERQAQFKAAAKKALALYRLRQEELAGESWEQRRHAMEHGDGVESLLRYIDAMREGTGKTPRWNQIKAFLLGEHGFMRQMGTGQGKSMVGALDTLWQLSRGEPVELASGESVRVHHVITTTEVLANEGVREFAPVLRSLGYEVARWDPHNPPGEVERPTVYYMTYDERATAELFDRPPPGKTATIDEADAVLVHNQTVHYQSEGQREIASEVEAAGVYRVRDFLKAVLRSRITAAEDLSVHLEKALHDGPLTAQEAGAVRAMSAEEVGAARTLTARLLREQPEECLDTVSRLWESYARRKFTAEEAEMARAFLDVKAGRLKLNRDFQVFGEGSEKKVQILDEYGKPRSDPKIGTESRWFGGRHKMVEAMFGAPVYSDGTGSKQVTVEDVLGGYEHLHLMSGTLERTAAEIKENFPVEGGLAKVEDFGRSKLVGEEDRIFLTEPEKLRDAVDRVRQLQAEGRPVLVICPFNDLARKFSLMLTKADVEHNAIDARWFAEHRDNNAAEENLLSVKDTAGVRGAVTVGTGMLGRGFDVSISDEVDQLGGVHAHMLGRSPTNPDEDHQWSARAGRNGRNGSFCFNVAASDRLYSEAQQHGARVAVTHYRTAVAKHAEATAEYAGAVRQVGNADAAQPGEAVRAARSKVAATAADVAAAEREMRSLTSPLQNDAADRTYLQRAMRRANQANAPPAAGDFAAASATSPQNTIAAGLPHTGPGAAHTAAGVDQTRSDAGHAGAGMDRAAMEAVHAGPDAVQPHLRGDRFARLAGWLGIPASVQAAAAMFDTDDDDDPLSRLLERAGVSSAAVEALNQHLDHAPPAVVMQADGLTDEQALNHLTPQRNRLAAELGWEPAQVAGAEGVRQVGAAVDTAREELADLLDVPATEVNAATARDVLADAAARLLAPTGTAGDPVTELLVFAASTYLAVTALLDLTVAIHQRSPKSCVNNGVTMMRVLYPDNEHAYHMPDDMPLRGHDAEDTQRAFGGAFRAYGSLDEAAESLKEWPGGSQALVYKWMNKGQVESHLVLLVNDSDRRDAPNLVVVDIAAAPGQVPITPADLAGRPALLNKAVPFQQWRREQQALIERLKEADRGVFAIEFDNEGRPLVRVSATQRSAVASQNPGLPPASLWSSRAPPLRRNEFVLAGHRPSGDGFLPDGSVPADTSQPDTQPSNVGSGPAMPHDEAVRRATASDSMEGRIGSRPPAGRDREPTWYERIAAGFTAADAERTGRATQGGTPELGWLTSVLGVPTAYFDSPVGMTVLGERPEDALAADILSLWHSLGALAAEFENRGFGQWYERTMLRLTSWVVSTPVQRYRNFYSAEQGGIDDRRVPLGASGEVGLAGNLHAVLKTSQGTPGGGVMFDEMWDELGDIVHGIEGYWVRDRLHLTDNLDTFNACIRKGLSPEDAARATFTGKMADRKGFTEVVVGDLDGEPGDYDKVEVTFVRPSRLWEVRCRTLAHQTGVQFPELLNRVGWSAEIARLREHAARQHASMRRTRSHRPGDAEVPADWLSWQQAIEAKVARVEQLAEWVARWWAEQDAQDHAAVTAVAADVVRRHPGARWVTPDTVLLPSRTVVVIAGDGRHDDALTDVLLRNLALRAELATAGYDVRRLKPVVEYDGWGNPAVRAEDLGTVRVGGMRGPGGYIGSRPSSDPGNADRGTADVGTPESNPPIDADELGGLLAEHGVAVGRAATRVLGADVPGGQDVDELSVPEWLYRQCETEGWTPVGAPGRQVLAHGRFRVSVGWPGVGTEMVSHEDLAGRSWQPAGDGPKVAALADAYAWLQETQDQASADRIKAHLLSPARPPLPAEVIAREIDEVTEILRARVPQEQIADPEIRRGIRLAAEGLFASRTLYGHPDIGRANHLHDDAFELREFGVAALYHNGMGVAEDLRHIMDNGVLQGAELREIMSAIVADAWSDLVYGGGRRSDNPEGYDELRSAQLLHARALSYGYDAGTARILGFAVNGTGFDERTGTQMIASPTAAEELRQRWGKMTDGEFHTATRVAEWVAAADLQTLSEADAVVQSIELALEDLMSRRFDPARVFGQVLSEWGARVNDVDEALRLADRFGRLTPEDGHVTVRQALIHRLRGNAEFTHPDSGYRPPDGWLLANRDMRRDHAAKLREIADRLASDPVYTPLDAYRDARSHAAEMRERYSGFRWQVVVGPGAHASDPAVLAATVAARLPESDRSGMSQSVIETMPRVAEIARAQAGDAPVIVVTSSQDTDGRPRLVAQLDYTRPDATDPAPGVTPEELRRELSDVDCRIDIETADALPRGQVWHRLRLDFTRQRIATLPEIAPAVSAAVRSLLPDISGTPPADPAAPGRRPTGPDRFDGYIGSRPEHASAGAESSSGDERERFGNQPTTGRSEGPAGLIGSRPQDESSSGDGAPAGPDFQDLVLAGRESGPAERSLVEDAPGVRVESVTFGNGTRVFAETYTDPVAALEQVLQRKVAAIMDAPVGRTCLILEDDTVYREIVPGQPGNSAALDQGILGSRSATRLGLFDAVTRTNRAAREWSLGPDNEVRGGRAPSAIDATPTGAFAAMFVRQIDGDEVWQHHGMPRSELSTIRERVAYLQSWISDLPIPKEYKPALHRIHGRYMDALAEIEWRAVRTPDEISRRAGLHAEAQAKARLVEAFNLDYPHITIAGFEHPDVPAHVVEEILGALDEMLTRFPGRSNIRGLWIDYLGDENAGAASFAQRDSESTFRTLGIQFSLRNASRPAWTVERGIEMRERGLNPIGDRPFHHDAVHEFIHAIDAVELLSVTLRQVLHEIWSELDELGLIRETEQTWLSRLPAYAFVDGTKAKLREHEALAVGFAETDLHGAAVGTPQWAIHEYVTAGRPPQITPDLIVDLPAQGNQPLSAPYPEGTGDGDVTRPSRDPDPDAVPSGSEAVVPVLGADHGPPGFLQEQRGLQRQNEAAVVLARAGFRVEQHPVESGARLPDFRIEGKLFDCYSPATGRVSNICFEIRRKVYVKRQAERIVVNLADSTADPGELSLALHRHPIPNLREILAIDPHGTVLRLWPGPVTVVGIRPDTGNHGFIGSRPPEHTPEPLDSGPDSAFTSDVRLLNEAVRDGRGPLRGEHFPVPGLRMRSNDPGRNAALRMFSLWQAHVANRGLGKLVSRWDSGATPAARRRVLAELYFWVSQQRYMRQVWAVGRDPSLVGEHGESHPDYFRTRLSDDAPNMDRVGHMAGLRAGVRRDPQTGKWHGGVGTPAFWTTLAIGRLVRNRLDVEAPGNSELQNVVELPGGARVDGNVLYAHEHGRFVIETAQAGDQRTIFDAAVAELAAALDQRSAQPSADVLRRFANAVYLLFQAPLMTRGSDATIRTFAATVFTFAFGRPLRLPHDIDLQAMSRRQPDFVEWFTGALERGLRRAGESDAAGRPDALRETSERDRPPGFIGSRPEEQSEPSLDAARGAWLKALRLEQGMKQKEVAQAAGLTNAALSNIENGRRTSLGAFQQVCRVLGVEGEALTEATRRFYPGVELETDAAAHNSPSGWVTAHRNSRGMTKADLARAVGVTPTRIGEIENGDRPPPNLFYRIARALGVEQQALAEATRSLYPDLVLDLEPTAHDPASPGNWIMTLRHSKDMTQAELARTAGTSAGYIAGIEGGEYTPSSIIFRRICRALEVAPKLLGAATHHFYPDLELELGPGTHDPASPGSWIVALRHDRDLTRTELAKAIGPGWGHLAHIETGNYVPRFAVFRRICEVLGIDDELLRAATRHFYPHIDLDLEPAAHDLGRWITALRHDRDMSRAELARVTGLSTKYLAQVETENRRPRFGTFRRICRALGVSGGLLIQAVRDFYPDITADIDPASHESLGRWIAALRNDEGMSVTELAQRARMPRSTLSSIENNRYLPRLRKLRQLCRAQGVGGDLFLEIVERFYADRYERSGYADEEELFKRYVVTRVGSPEEREVQDEIFERFAWVPKALARRESPDIRDDAVQAAAIGMLSAITNHVPSASFAAHAWASCRAAVFRYRLALRFPDLDNRTRKLVSTVEAQIHRMVAAGAALEDTEIARGAGLKVADVALAREILARPTLRLDAPISGNDRSTHRDVADPVPAGFSDTDFAMTVRAALADMADPATAERLVMLHLVEGMSLARAAERLGLPATAAADVLADTVVRLRGAFDHREPADVTASEQNRPTPWSKARAEQEQPPTPSVSHGDSAPDEGMTRPDGFIGSRPPDPGESSHGEASEETPRTTPWSRLSDSDAHDGVDGEGETAEMATAGTVEARAEPASTRVVETLLGYLTRRDTIYWCQLKPDSLFPDWGWSSDEQLPDLAPDLPLSCIDMVVYAAVAAGALDREQVRAIYNWDDPDDFSRRWVHELPGLLVPAGRRLPSDRDAESRPQHGDVVMWFGTDKPGGDERLMHVAVADGKADRSTGSASVLSFGADCSWLLSQPRRGETRMSGVELTTIADLSNTMLANWSHTVRVEFGPGPWTQPPAIGELRVPPSRESRALRPFNKKNWRREFPGLTEWAERRSDAQQLIAVFDEWEQAAGAAGARTRLIEMVDAAVSSTRMEGALRSSGALPIDGHPQVAVQVDRDGNPTGLKVASMGGHGRVLRKLFTERPDVLDTIPRPGGRLRIAYDDVKLRSDGEVRSEHLQPDDADSSRKSIPGRLLHEYLRLCSEGALDKAGTKLGKSPRRPSFQRWIEALPPSVFKGPDDTSYALTSNGHMLTDRAVEEGCRPPRADQPDDPHGAMAALRRIVLEGPDDVARPTPSTEQPAPLTERASEVFDLGVVSANVTVGKDPSGRWRLLVQPYAPVYPGEVLTQWCAHLHAGSRRRLLNLIRRQLSGRVVDSPTNPGAGPGGYIGSLPTDSSDSEPPASAAQEGSARRADPAAFLPPGPDEDRRAPVHRGASTVPERLPTEEFAADPPDGSAPSAAWPTPNGAQPFRQWLKAARLARGLTQAGLAARMGIPNSATYIGSLERGVTITRDMAVRLLEGLGAPDEIAETVLREYFSDEDGEFPDPWSDRFRHPKDWIIAARTSKGLSRTELAARAGVGLTGLSQKERAQNPRGEFGISPDYALRLLAGLDAPPDIATAFLSRFYPGWSAEARADERGSTGPEGFIGSRPGDDAPSDPVRAGHAGVDPSTDLIGPVDARAGLPTYTPPDAEMRMRADRVLREHWGAGAKPDDLVYRWRRSTTKRGVAAEECAEHAAQNARRARNLSVDEMRALVRVWPEFVGKAGGFPTSVRDRANRWALAKARIALDIAAAATRLSGRERALRAYLLNVEDLLIRAGQRAATVETPGVPAPTVLLERLDTDDPGAGSIMISFGSREPVAEAWHVDGTDRDLRRLDQRMQLACNHYESAMRENPKRPVRVVVWSGTDGHRLAGDMAALSAELDTSSAPYPATRPERQLVVHGNGGRPAKKALAHERAARTVDTVVVCGKSNLGTMSDALAGIASPTDVYYGIASRSSTLAIAKDLPSVQFACRFPTGDAACTNAVLKDVRDRAQRYEKEPFEAGKPIDDEFLLYVDDRTKAPTESLENMGRILAGCPDRVTRHDPAQNGWVRFTEVIQRAVDEQTESVYAGILPRNPHSGVPTLSKTGSDAAIARSAIEKRGGPGAGPQVLLHRGLPDDFTRAGRLAVDNKRWWHSLHRDEQRAVVAFYPGIVGNAPGLPSDVSNYANDYSRYATASAIHAKGSKNASRIERQAFKNLYAVGEALTRSVTVHRDIPPPVVATVALDPEAFGGNGSGTFVIGNCRLEDAEHVVWYVDGVNTRLQSAPARLASARNLYEELVRADRSTKVAVVCWIGYEAPANNKEAWASRPGLAEAGGRLFARDVLALRAVISARLSKLGYSYGTPVVAEGGVGGRLDGVFEHGVVTASPGRGLRFDSAGDASCRNSWVLAQSDDPVTGFGGDAPEARGRLLGAGPFGLGTDPATDTNATRVRAERGFPHSLAPFDGHGEYLQYSLVGAAQPTESLRHAAWCLAGRGDEVPTEQHRPTVGNPTAMHRIRARVVDAARDRRAPQLDAALAAPEDHRPRRDLPGPVAVATDRVGSPRSNSVEAAGAAVGPPDVARAGPRLAVQVGKGGLADAGRACAEALTIGVNAIVVEVGRAAGDMAALDAMCRSAAFEDAVLSVEVPAGPAWSESVVRAKVREIAATLERHGIRGELHAFDHRVLTAAAELAPDRQRVAMVNMLTVVTKGMRGVAGWMARPLRPGAEKIDAIIDDARRAGATGIAIPYPLLSEHFVRRTVEAETTLAVWGGTGSARIREMLRMGVGTIWTRKTEELALLRAEVVESGFRIPEAFPPSTSPLDGPPRATPWSGSPGR
ncbi:helix-turn-helix domain-containing protein [Nocardia abscessus]|uniref:helix-turn-helix domain-containing protein n=1 Tax=Nocardia abscessus TaxID=120957 RepID=UPI001894D8C1|nr:helix-turn-helix domain-containing protein [Nocardia abscessus]MBF6338830.1 helix-turn-helix domain-containing protein [Nocardia abscessus]